MCVFRIDIDIYIGRTRLYIVLVVCHVLGFKDSSDETWDHFSKTKGILFFDESVFFLIFVSIFFSSLGEKRFIITHRELLNHIIASSSSSRRLLNNTLLA